jgi:hypothetical protein
MKDQGEYRQDPRGRAAPADHGARHFGCADCGADADPQGAGWDERSLYTLATKLRSEVAKVNDVGLTFITGGQREAIRVIPDPAKLAAARVPLSSVMEAIRQGGRSFPAERSVKMARRWP